LELSMLNSTTRQDMVFQTADLLQTGWSWK
jgi:hypothetical protein